MNVLCLECIVAVFIGLLNLLKIRTESLDFTEVLVTCVRSVLEDGILVVISLDFDICLTCCSESWVPVSNITNVFITAALFKTTMLNSYVHFHR